MMIYKTIRNHCSLKKQNNLKKSKLTMIVFQTLCISCSIGVVSTAVGNSIRNKQIGQSLNSEGGSSDHPFGGPKCAWANKKFKDKCLSMTAEELREWVRENMKSTPEDLY